MYPSEQADRVFVRLPMGMREAIRARAAANHRSMNAEIVHHLDRAIGFTGRQASDELGASEYDQ
jgi:plasmid stability protein